MPTRLVSVPTFLGGISQQPAPIRRENLVDDAVNFEFLPSTGATKRYPTEHVAQLDAGSLAGYRCLFVERDDTDYIVAIGDTDVKVFDSAGTAQTVQAIGGGAASFTYLSGVNYEDIRVQRIADTLFVANTATTVTGAAGPTGNSSTDPTSGGVFIRQGGYGVNYSVTIKTENMPDPVTVEYGTRDESPELFSKLIGDGNEYGGTAGTVPSAGQSNGTAPWRLNRKAYSEGWDDGYEFNSISDLQFQYDTGGGTWVDSPRSDWVADPFTLEVYYRGTVNFNSLNYPVRIGRIDTSYSAFLQPEYILRELIKRLVNAFDGTGTSGMADYRPLITIEGNTADFDEDTNPNSSIYFSFAETVEQLEVRDSQGDNYSFGWLYEIANIADLPIVFKDGHTVRIKGANTDQVDDYYVVFEVDNANSAFGRGVWNETTIRGASTGGLTASTMPHRLQRISGTTWEWGPETWLSRDAGDDETNEPPKFVGTTVNDIFFHQNRLGIIADNSVVFSEVGEVTNFWRTTVLSFPESDPINVDISGLDGNTLYHAQAFDERLFVFSETGQAAVFGAPFISAQTIESPVVSAYRCLADVSPVLIGRSLFFGEPTGEYAQVREFIPGSENRSFSDIYITLAVPELIPNTVRRLIPSSMDQTLVVLTDTADTIYIYQYFRAADELLQASWSKWTFADATILDCGFIRDNLFVLLLRDGATYLEKVELGPGRTDANNDFLSRIDRKTVLSSPTYSLSTDETSWTLPYTFDASAPMALVTEDGGTEQYGVQIPISSSVPASGILRAKGDYTGQPMAAGETYSSTLTMSKPLVRADFQQGRAALVGGVTTIRDLTVYLDNTGYLKGTVDYASSSQAEEEFLAERLDVALLDQSPLRSGEFNLGIHSDVEEFRVTLSNDTPIPCTVVSGAWGIRFNARDQFG